MNTKREDSVELHARIAVRKSTMAALRWARDKKGFSISGLVDRAVAEFFEREGWAEAVGPWEPLEPEDQAKVDAIRGLDGPRDENGNLLGEAS